MNPREQIGAQAMVTSKFSHHVELLRASCENNSRELALSLARQLTCNAQIHGMFYISSLAEKIEHAIKRGNKNALFEHLRSLEELIFIPNDILQLEI